jgi:hypothetical protein
MYKNFLTALVTRVNTITGVAYRDDPTIFAWELINEPRVPSDPSSNVLHVRARACVAHACTGGMIHHPADALPCRRAGSRRCLGRSRRWTRTIW